MKKDIDWIKYILWTIICICFGMMIGMIITKFYFEIDSKGDIKLGLFNSPTEAYEAAINYTLNHLI